MGPSYSSKGLQGAAGAKGGAAFLLWGAVQGAGLGRAGALAPTGFLLPNTHRPTSELGVIGGEAGGEDVEGVVLGHFLPIEMPVLVGVDHRVHVSGLRSR